MISILKRRGQKKGADQKERDMTFVEHLDELRMHIIRSIIAIGAFAIIIFFTTDFVFKTVIFGPLSKNFPTYQFFCWMGNLLKMPALCYDPVQPELQTFDMGEAFLLHIKVCLIGGVIVAFPYILYELWKFVRPGLYASEVKATRGVVGISSILFLLGVSFGYFILSPFAINFLVGYQLPMVNETTAIIKANSFINYMIMFTLPAGIIFELPIIIFYLARMGIVTPAGMRKYRRHSIIGILLLSAMITPPDVMTQIIVSIPVYILYEFSINIAARESKKRAKELELEDL
jgi:sec-independent protein translocase protein TatC